MSDKTRLPKQHLLPPRAKKKNHHPIEDIRTEEILPELEELAALEDALDQTSINKAYAESKQDAKDRRSELFPAQLEVPLSTRLKKTLNFQTGADVLKKSAGAIDDIPAAIPADALAMVGGLMLSGAGVGIGILGVHEDINAFLKAYHNKGKAKVFSFQTKAQIKAKEEQARQAQMTTAALQLGIDSGIISGSLLITVFEILSIVGLEYLPIVVSAPLPILIPAGILLRSGVELYLKGRALHAARKEENEAEKQYVTVLEHANKILPRLTSELEELARKKEKYAAKINEIKASPDSKNIKNLTDKINQVNEKQKELDGHYFDILQIVDRYKKQHVDCRKARLNAERKVGFAVTDTLLSVAVLTLFTVGILTGVAALGVASTFSFGAVPGFILMGGVGLMVLMKVLEVLDNKLFEGRISASIRATAINMGQSVKQGVTGLWKTCTRGLFSSSPAAPKRAEEQEQHSVYELRRTTTGKLMSKMQKGIRRSNPSTLLSESIPGHQSTPELPRSASFDSAKKAVVTNQEYNKPIPSLGLTVRM